MCSWRQMRRNDHLDWLRAIEEAEARVECPECRTPCGDSTSTYKGQRFCCDDCAEAFAYTEYVRERVTAELGDLPAENERLKRDLETARTHLILAAGCGLFWFVAAAGLWWGWR